MSLAIAIKKHPILMSVYLISNVPDYKFIAFIARGK